MAKEKSFLKEIIENVQLIRRAAGEPYDNIVTVRNLLTSLVVKLYDKVNTLPDTELEDLFFPEEQAVILGPRVQTDASF